MNDQDSIICLYQDHEKHLPCSIEHLVHILVKNDKKLLLSTIHKSDADDIFYPIVFYKHISLLNKE